MVLENESTWFGPGSRIVVTTENRELLQRHGIEDEYHVRFPSSIEALDILCRYAFRQRSLRYGLEELALKVTELCGKLPLGLRVLGSALRGKNKDQWEKVICRLETNLDHQDIEEVLRVGYASLHEKEQSLSLHIAVFFNCNDGNLVKAMFADDNLDIKYGLKILANKSLIHVSNDGEVVPYCIKALHSLHLILMGCTRLASLPELPRSLKSLTAEGCQSLETVFFPFESQFRFNTRLHQLLQIGPTSTKRNYPTFVSLQMGYITRNRSTCTVWLHESEEIHLPFISPDGNNPLSAL